MYVIIGIVTGIIINHYIIKPMERRRIRRQLVRDGIIPWDYKGVDIMYLRFDDWLKTKKGIDMAEYYNMSKSEKSKITKQYQTYLKNCVVN